MSDIHLLAEEMTRDELAEFIAAGPGSNELNCMLAGLCARGIQEGCQSLIAAGADECDYCRRAGLTRHPQFDHRAKMIIFLHVDLLEDVRRIIALAYLRETKNESAGVM
jgi:hypothetical protein